MIKQYVLVSFAVVSTLVCLTLIGITDITAFVWVDGAVNGTCIVLMYAMYEKEYLKVCGRVHSIVNKCVSR